MVKYLFSLLCVLVLCSCSSDGIGKNPVADGQDMMFQSMTALKDGNTDKANDIIGRYLDYYEKTGGEKRAEFCKASSERFWQEMMGSDSREWKEFFAKMRPLMQWYMESGEAMSSLPNFDRLKAMQVSELEK